MSEAVLPDSPSLAQLVERHTRAIRRFIRRRSGAALLKRATVDDLFQETVTAAFHGAKRGNFTFVDHGTFLSWMYTIARRVMSKTMTDSARGPYVTRIRGASSSGTGIRESRLAAPGRTPSSVVGGRERRAALFAAIQGLPKEYREVLVLYKMKQYSLAEMADRLGCSKPAVCAKIGRAVRLLQEELQDR